MKLFTNLLSLCLMAGTLISFSSCETSKIAYGNAYYFKATPKPTASKEVAPAPQAEKLEANFNKKKEVLPDLEERIIRVEEKFEDLQVVQRRLEEAKVASAELSRSEMRQIIKKEKAERKALRKEVKSLVKEYKQAPERLEQEEKVSGNTRTGIILGAIGLVLVLIGGPVLYTIGAILLVVGLVLILLDVL